MTETYKKISFEKVRSIIEKILGCSIKDKLELDPDEIHRLAENNGIKLNWKPIENWTKFEYGQVDIDEKDFLEIIFKNIKPVGQIAIVTDKCFREKEAYLVDGKNLENFISNIYPDITILTSSSQKILYSSVLKLA